MLNQSIDTGEAGPLGRLASEDAEPDFDLIEPTGRSRGGVRFHVRMPDQVAQRIERRLYLSYPARSPPSQLLCRVPTTDNDSTGLATAALTDADDQAHVADHCLKAARLVPKT